MGEGGSGGEERRVEGGGSGAAAGRGGGTSAPSGIPTIGMSTSSSASRMASGDGKELSSKVT